MTPTNQKIKQAHQICHYTWKSSYLGVSFITILNVNYDIRNINTLFKRFQHGSQKKKTHVTEQIDHSMCNRKLLKLHNSS